MLVFEVRYKCITQNYIIEYIIVMLYYIPLNENSQNK